MRKPWRYAALAAALCCASVAFAQLDLSDFDDDLMRNMDDATKDLEPAIAAKNGKAALEDLAILQDGFTQTEAYFAKKGVDDAVGYARDQQAQALALGQQLGAKDFDAAAATARRISKGCKTCHDAYKPLTK
ncbi:hypothetical protein SAMN04488038_104161 [Solimonas aquatica]|uniref:Cytochrome C n=1 Tax=Solimonas aquatica TaxID=489703 RepID=A0A1H9DTG1_9GAMM|nr:hypothetical protein [Solimonas aquatica]SEQ16759.1 hypothetical protein SAMN04488038_104161 [Solimonas aquatica]